MQSSVSFDDIFASQHKYGHVLEINYKKINDLKTKNPKTPYDVTYIPLLFKHINGKLIAMKLNFNEQMIASGAKIPQGNDENSVVKNFTITFKSMLECEIAGGDYVPKKKDNDQDQEKENIRISTNIERYMSSNSTFLRILDIIDISYKRLCEELKSKEKTLDFRLKKNKKMVDIAICSIKQSTREDKDTNTEVDLETPLYRLKIPVCKYKFDPTINKEDHNGKIGIYSNYYKEFKPTVFDARKMTKKNNYAAVPAYIKVGNKLNALDVYSITSFITYKSLVGGIISFDCITASNAGLSLSNSFYELYVFRHKTKVVQQSITKNDILAMRGGEEEDDNSDSDVQESKDDENDEDDEEEEEDDGDDGNAEPYDDDEPNESNESNELINEVADVKIEDNTTEVPKKTKGRKKKVVE
jgi:hypothetical protein